MTKADAESEDLAEKVKLLETELQAAKTELAAVNKKWEKSERLLERATNYNEDLCKQLEELNSKLHAHRISQQNRTDACVQVEEKDISESYGDKPLPEWNVGGGEEVSIADSLKATAEAAVLEQSGYVFDQTSGLYYDYNSGYYYDATQQLYYDPGSGTYFYYNQTTGQYEFHSQVTPTQSQQSGGQGQTVTPGCDPATQGRIQSGKKRQPNTKGKERKERKEHRKQRKRKGKHSKERKLQHKDTSPSRARCNDSDTRHGEIPAKDEDVEMIPEDQNDQKNSLKPGAVVEVERMEEDKKDAESSDGLATGESELESGEITSDTSEEEVEEKETEEDYKEMVTATVEYSASFQAKGDTEPVEELSSSWPPCIRIIVSESDCVEAGSFFMITCTGGSIGRDKSNTVCIPDVNISKTHAEVSFDYQSQCYVIMDTGSQIGTALNGMRMSLPKKASHKAALGHGDTVQVGGTTLLMHIHPGTDTCDDCEPGQVQARLKATASPATVHVVLTKRQRIRKQKEELHNLKKKFGLKADHFVEHKTAITNPAYSDRAAHRRHTVGSDVPAAKSEAPASVYVPIAETNKGHKLLSKMGWKEGQGLGKSNDGMALPIDVHIRANSAAGLGSQAGKKSLDDVHTMQKSQRWLQAQKRYQKLTGVEAPAPSELPASQMAGPTSFELSHSAGPTEIPGQTGTARPKKKFGQMTWVSGGVQKPS